MNKIKKYLLIDVETANEITHPLVYDIGGLVVDRHGNIYEQFSFVIRETFYNVELMEKAFYASKIPTYIDDISNQKRKVKPFKEVVDIINGLVEQYNIKTICAYNASFDIRAMKNTSKLLLKKENWLNRNLDVMCLWHGACQLLYNKKYIKTAIEKGWLSEKGNIKTSAEMGYKFISGKDDFEEDHTGLEDCLIEYQIMIKIIKKKKKFNKKPNGFCWKIVQKKRKELGL